MLFNILIFAFLLFTPQVKDQKNPKDLTEKAFKKIETSNYNDALDLFNKALKLDKNCKEAYLGKGIAYYKSGDYSKRDIYPEEFIKKALKIDQDYFDAKVHLGWCYYFKGQHDQAVEHITYFVDKVTKT